MKVLRLVFFDDDTNYREAFYFKNTKEGRQKAEKKILKELEDKYELECLGVEE